MITIIIDGYISDIREKPDSAISFNTLGITDALMLKI